MQVIQISQTHLLMCATDMPMINTNLHMFARSRFHFEEADLFDEIFPEFHSKNLA